MFRRLLDILLLISLVLCVATLVLWAIPNRSYQPVDLKALSWFDLDPSHGTTADIPEKWRALDGKPVVLDGFMFSARPEAGVSAFQLVDDLKPRRWGGPPLVQERVFAQLPAGRNVPYTLQLVQVYGTLHVNVRRADSVVRSVFELDVDNVLTQPLPIVTPAYRITGFFAAIAICSVVALLVGKYLKRLWRSRQPMNGVCRGCGYDLRATPDRCPECGLRPKAMEGVSYWEGKIGE